MVFVTISPTQAAQYEYICNRLKQMVDKMCTARKTLEAIANRSFDKAFSRCVYMLTSESLQCENEIRSHIGSLNCNYYEEEPAENKKLYSINNIAGVDAICNYFEEVYLKSYRKLLKDKRFSNSIKSLIQNHLQLFMQSLTQLKLFNDVKTAMN
jgi:hypothetical protein